MNDGADNSRSSPSSSAIVAVVVLLPLIYALSFGPAAFVFNKYSALKPMENAALAFYAPLFWLHENTSLKQPLQSYLEWWERLARK